MHPLHEYIARQVAEWVRSRWSWSGTTRAGSSSRSLPSCSAAAPIQVGPVAVAAGRREGGARRSTGSMFEIRAVVEPLVTGDKPEPLVVYVPGASPETNRVGAHGAREGRGPIRDPAQAARPEPPPPAVHGRRDRRPARARRRHLRRPRARGDARRRQGALDPQGRSTTTFPGATRCWRRGWPATTATKRSPPRAPWTSSSSCWPRAPGSRSTHRTASPSCGPSPAVRAGRRVPRRPHGCRAGECRRRSPRPRPSRRSRRSNALAERLRAVARQTPMSPWPTSSRRSSASPAAGIAPDQLGATDTFRFEERLILGHVGDLIADGRYDEAQGIISDRERSFWLELDVSRRAQWQVCRLMAQLGQVAAEVSGAVAATHGTPDTWIAKYADAGPAGTGSTRPAQARDARRIPRRGAGRAPAGPRSPCLRGCRAGAGRAVHPEPGQGRLVDRRHDAPDAGLRRCRRRPAEARRVLPG